MSAGEKRSLSQDDFRALAIELYQQDLFGVREDPADFITLKSGRISPHYLNMRPGISHHMTRHVVSNSLVRLTRAHNGLGDINTLSDSYDHVAGTPEAMTSYAVRIADLGRISLLQPRVSTAKDSGNKASILGRYESGDTVALYDDVVTDGQSKIETIEKLAAAELVTSDYFVVLDREEGGSPQVAIETGVKIVPALQVSGLVRQLRADDMISAVQYDNVAKYLDQYGEPHARETMETAI